MKEDMAIFVDSFDGYSDLWDTFFKIFFHYWNDCPYNVYLVNNNKDYSNKSISVINTGQEINWFHRTIMALEKIKEPYILFMLEDYFLGKSINNENVNKVLEHIKSKDIFYYQVSGRPQKEKRIYKIKNTNRYPINLQMAIWNRKKFLEILQKMEADGASSPWDFERYFVREYSNSTSEEVIKGAEYDSRDIFGYHNGVLQGKWIRSTLRYYKGQGLEIDTKQRDVLSLKKTIFIKSEVFVLQHTSRNTAERIKAVMKKFGFKFMS